MTGAYSCVEALPVIDRVPQPGPLQLKIGSGEVAVAEDAVKHDNIFHCSCNYTYRAATPFYHCSFAVPCIGNLTVSMQIALQEPMPPHKVGS